MGSTSNRIVGVQPCLIKTLVVMIDLHQLLPRHDDPRLMTTDSTLHTGTVQHWWLIEQRLRRGTRLEG